MNEYRIDIPWKDCSKWKAGHWYPMPLGDMSDRVPLNLYIVDGWGVFSQNDEQPEDMDMIAGRDRFTFSQTVEICEAHNGEVFDIEGMCKKQETVAANV